MWYAWLGIELIILSLIPIYPHLSILLGYGLLSSEFLLSIFLTVSENTFHTSITHITLPFYLSLPITKCFALWIFFRFGARQNRGVTFTYNLWKGFLWSKERLERGGVLGKGGLGREVVLAYPWAVLAVFVGAWAWLWALWGRMNVGGEWGLSPWGGRDVVWLSGSGGRGKALGDAAVAGVVTSTVFVYETVQQQTKMETQTRTKTRGGGGGWLF